MKFSLGGGNSNIFLGIVHPKNFGFHDSQFDGIINFTIGLVKNHQLVADFLETFSWMGGLGGDPKNKMFRDAKCAVSIFVFCPKVSFRCFTQLYPTSHISHQYRD